ncbi:PAS domain-containing protein [candidate division GN15 bacterium]|nr:PAS domain-containing protein [candidate division GN15 bacterium]
MEKRSSTDRLDKLREKIEQLRTGGDEFGAGVEYDDVVELVQELETYQAELLQANEDLRETHEKLERVGRKYFDLYDLAPVGYLTLNRDGLITGANLSAAGLLEMLRGRLVGRLLSGFIHAESRSDYLHLLQEIRSDGDPASSDVRLTATGDELRYAKLNISPAPESFEMGNELWVTLTDISDLKRLEKERQDLNRSLGRYSRRLEASNRELEAFSYSVSHDLRAPLRSVGGFAEALREEAGEKLDERTRGYLDRIVEASGHMQQIVDGLLSLSRLTRADLRRTRVDLAEHARKVVAVLQEQEPERSVTFLIPNRLIVEGDNNMLQVALDNLISNAWKFTRECDVARIELGETSQAGHQVIYMRDNGMGFDARHAEKIFEPFQQAHRQDKGNGIGVGLAIVRRVINRHGGRIWAEGQKGLGTTISFTLSEGTKE